MKYIFLMSLLFLFKINFAQIYVDGKNINEDKNIHYIRISIGNSAIVGTSLKVYVDYGQTKPAIVKAIKDKNGHLLVFNSFADVINYFYNHGWKYIGTIKSRYVSVGNESYIFERISQ